MPKNKSDQKLTDPWQLSILSFLPLLEGPKVWETLGPFARPKSMVLVAIACLHLYIESHQPMLDGEQSTRLMLITWWAECTNPARTKGPMENFMIYFILEKGKFQPARFTGGDRPLNSSPKGHGQHGQLPTPFSPHLCWESRIIFLGGIYISFRKVRLI